MPFQVSPGISITEKDFTQVTPAVSTTIGGIVGQFGWGSCDERIRMTSENELVSLFGEPTADNFEYFWPAANYLAYGSNLLVVRVVADDARNGVVGKGVAGTPVLNKNSDGYDANFSANTDQAFIAKYPGKKGNSLSVYAIDKAGWTAAEAALAGNSATDTQKAFLANFSASPDTSTNVTNAGGTNDEMHVMVIDRGGLFTNVAGEVLELHAFVSKAGDAKRIDGSNNYVKEVLRNESRYVYLGALDQFLDSASLGEAKAGKAFADLDATASVVGGDITGGVDGTAATAADLILGYDLFDNAETVDVTLLMAGGSAKLAPTNARSVGSHIIGIAEQRKDCVAFVSPSQTSVVGKTSNAAILTDIKADKAGLNPNTSYGVMDSAWKYQYDRYRDVFVYVPMNGDVAGLCARTDFSNDPWYSPAGFNRGVVRNIVKTSWEARKADRDELYKIAINPFATQQGSGVILFGDKTMQVTPSAFDRINVRRLFIVLEKTISIAARGMLFEFNDDFTRAQFVSIVAPFLREVQGRRGITDFKVICNETNNTGQIIDTNQFVGDIYVKPNRSINFIQLNFIATRTDVAFTEIGA